MWPVTAPAPDAAPAASDLTPARERWLLLVLGGVQFTYILDFMVVTPLGPVLTALFRISDAQFASLVSGYSMAAALSGLLVSTYVDRFSRKRVLLALYALFGLSVAASATATSFGTLLAARMACGLFGGVLTGLIHLVIADTIPFARRGRATSVVVSAFSLASVAGVPFSLLLGAAYSWRAPFMLVGAIICAWWLLALWQLPSMTSHLQQPRQATVRRRIIGLLGDANVRRAFLITASMMAASFSVIPFVTIHATSNVGIGIAQLPWLYLCGGLATMVAAPLVGRAADRFGKRRTFQWIALAAAVPLVGLPLLPAAPLGVLLVVTTFFFVLVSARMIPGMAMLSAAAPLPVRGTFMTLNASVQQASMGIGALGAGLILARGAHGELLHFGWVGLMAAGLSILAVALSSGLQLHESAPGR